jgi:acyl carrier protein
MNQELEAVEISSIPTVRQPVADILYTVLGLSPEQLSLSDETLLLGVVPELDSMAIMAIVTAIEADLGTRIDDDEINAEVFLNFATLCQFYLRLANQNAQQEHVAD